MPTKLGQNFLKGKVIAEKIVKAANLKSSDFIIEIGPGKGILTEKLAKHAKKVVAIEIDEKLVDYLRKKFTNQKNIEIIHADILKTNLSKLVTSYGLQVTGYKIVANIPYYITSPIIRLFLETEYPPQEMILMAQKEVAERITVAPGKMSLLSISVQYYAKPEILFYVDKKFFDPVPKVDSTIIKITYNQQFTTYNKENAKKFFRIVRAGFCAKRKTLANNLSNSLKLDKKELQKKLKATGISPTARAQELSVRDWEKLIEQIKNAGRVTS